MNKRILIIHTNPVVRQTIASGFADFEVIIHENTQSAIDWLEAGNTAHVIMTGLQMAKRESITFISAIRLSSFFREVPIILISAETDSMYARIECLEAGADDCLLLPIHSLEISARVRSILRRHNWLFEKHFAQN